MLDLQAYNFERYDFETFTSTAANTFSNFFERFSSLLEIIGFNNLKSLKKVEF